MMTGMIRGNQVIIIFCCRESRGLTRMTSLYAADNDTVTQVTTVTETTEEVPEETAPVIEPKSDSPGSSSGEDSGSEDGEVLAQRKAPPTPLVTLGEPALPEAAAPSTASRPVTATAPPAAASTVLLDAAAAELPPPPMLNRSRSIDRIRGEVLADVAPPSPRSMAAAAALADSDGGGGGGSGRASPAVRLHPDDDDDDDEEEEARAPGARDGVPSLDPSLEMGDGALASAASSCSSSGGEMLFDVLVNTFEMAAVKRPLGTVPPPPLPPSPTPTLTHTRTLMFAPSSSSLEVWT